MVAVSNWCWQKCFKESKGRHRTTDFIFKYMFIAKLKLQKIKIGYT
jgi:hypothetical protein